jgi:peptide/nickel transport system permease protein
MAIQTTAGRFGAVGARRPGLVARAAHFVRTKPLGALGGTIVLGLFITALFAPWLAPYDPLATNPDLLLLPPEPAHPFGTDDFGRDVFSRVIAGARISILVSFIAIGASSALGTLIGLISGYAEGWTDNISMRVMDVVLCVPTIVLALAMVAMLGPSLRNVTIAIAFVQLPVVARLIRGAVLTEKQNQYVEAARAVGAGHVRMLGRHLLPNVMAPVIVISTINLGFAILAEATLSFLGLGEPPPTPSWGQMLGGKGRDYFEVAPWMAVFPGIAITVAVLGFNLLGDTLRDLLDPRLRGSQ